MSLSITIPETTIFNMNTCEEDIPIGKTVCITQNGDIVFHNSPEFKTPTTCGFPLWLDDTNTLGPICSVRCDCIDDESLKNINELKNNYDVNQLAIKLCYFLTKGTEIIPLVYGDCCFVFHGTTQIIDSDTVHNWLLHYDRKRKRCE